MKKLLVVILLVLVIVGCGKVSGTYYKKGRTDEYVRLLENGTFSSKERPSRVVSPLFDISPISFHGRWSKTGNILELLYEDTTAHKPQITCTLKGKVLTDEDGHVWVK